MNFHSYWTRHENILGCGADQFECNDGECIDWDKKCDGTQHCSGEGDEDCCKGTHPFRNLLFSTL